MLGLARSPLAWFWMKIDEIVPASLPDLSETLRTCNIILFRTQSLGHAKTLGHAKPIFQRPTCLELSHQLSGSEQTLFRDMSRTCQGTFPRNIQEMSRTSTYSRTFPQVSTNYPGNSREMSGNWPGTFPNMFRTFPGKLRGISRKCPETIPEVFKEFGGICLGHVRKLFREISGKFPGSFWENFPNTSSAPSNLFGR